MSHCEQYEVWMDKQGHWEMSMSFFDWQLASGIISRHAHPMRVVHAVYDGGKLTRQQVLAEIGGTRQQP